MTTQLLSFNSTASESCSRTRARDPNAYFLDPFTQYYLGDNFFAAGFLPNIYCLIAWGRIELKDFEQLRELLLAGELQAHQERRQLVCHEGIQGASTLALMAFFEFVRKHPHYHAGVIREAVSRGPGLVGMIAEGFYRTTPIPYSGRAFQSRELALQWLAPEVLALPILNALQSLTQRFCTQLEPLIAEARLAIEELGVQATLPSVAQHLAVSPRTLQRKLQAAGTRFDTEMTSLRMKSARELLLNPQLNTKSIAADLGYSSLSAFISAFRRFEGTTPAEWRKENVLNAPRSPADRGSVG